MIKPWTTTELHAAATLWRSGQSLRQIADSLERSVDSVKQKMAVQREIFPRRKRLRGTADKLVPLRFEVSKYLYKRIQAAARKKNISISQHVNATLAKHYMKRTAP